MIIAIEKYSTAIPPNNKRENRTNNVVNEVISVLDNVWFIDLFRIFSGLSACIDWHFLLCGHRQQ